MKDTIASPDGPYVTESGIKNVWGKQGRLNCTKVRNLKDCSRFIFYHGIIGDVQPCNTIPVVLP